MSSVGIVRTGLAGLLLLSLVAPAPEGVAEVSESARLMCLVLLRGLRMVVASSLFRWSRV